MPVGPKRIVILLHERETPASVRAHLISYIADHWREDGHEVVYLFGTSTWVPADAILVHVNLSVVPETYLTFARQYPIALNARVRDIRKSAIGQQVVRRDDAYDGKVIVKSDLNYAGEPERRFERAPLVEGSMTARVLNRLHRLRYPSFRSPSEYLIYDHLSLVPRRYFSSKDLVIQKFLPEMDGDMYCVRCWHVLGDRTFAVRLKSSFPVVNGATHQSVERIEPHPDIVAARDRLAIDYGKLDYVIVGTRAILLDVNKTIGMNAAPGGIGNDPQFVALRRFRAEGLYSYFRE